MADSRQIQKAGSGNTVQIIKDMTKQGGAMYNRFYEVMQEKTPQFLASVINAVSNNDTLMKCDPTSILKCAMQSASLGLDVNPNLGQAAIVPYSNSKKINGRWEKVITPQFQIMWKGFVQLAQNTEKYNLLNCDIVFDDEFGGRNLITGEVNIKYVPGGMRDRFISAASYEDAKKCGICGVFFYFRLTNGFEKTEYWSLEQCRQHGRAYSKSYQNDVYENKSSSVWSTNFLAMAKKTVVKNTLSKYGPLSTDYSMQKAFSADQQGINPNTGEMEYIDNQTDEEEQKPEKPAKGTDALRSFMNASKAEDAEIIPSDEENTLTKQETANPAESEEEYREDYGEVEDPSLWN